MAGGAQTRQRLTLVLSLAFMIVPYVIVTYHYTHSLPASSHARPPTPQGKKPPTEGEPQSLDLSGYWAAIREARQLLDALNTTTTTSKSEEEEEADSDASFPAVDAAQPKPEDDSSASRNKKKKTTTNGGKTKTGRRKDLAIGLAKDIPTANLAVFAASLRRRAPDAECVLLVDRPSIDAELRAIAADHDVDLRAYDVDALEPEYLRRYHPSTFRWPLIANYLETRAKKSSEDSDDAKPLAVLFADARDTAFQDDPFRNVPTTTPFFFAFHGVESRTIGQCGWNGGWVKDCFGDAAFKRLSRKPILCSGVSLADFDSALAYAQKMRAIVAHRDFAKCERNGVDQGVHNVLLHDGKVAAAKLVPQRDALVANLQAKVAIVGKDFVVTRPSDTKRVAVVHQYDRVPDLAAHYYRTFYKNTDATAGRATGGHYDAPPDACAKYDVRTDVDLFKAKCDLSVASGTSPTDCCKSCAKLPSCRGFTLAGSLCYLKSCGQPATNVRMPGATSGFLRALR